jgi:heme/copper-type cytochrome/quinol oxidase subunit 2
MIMLLAQIAPSSTNPEAMIAAAIAAAQAQQAAFNASMVSIVVLALMLVVLIVMGIMVYRVDALVRIGESINRKLGGRSTSTEYKAPEEEEKK